MKATGKYSIGTLFFIICLLSSIMIVPSIQAATKTTDNAYIIDDADLLSSDEQTDLNELANKYSQKHNTTILVITTDDTNSLSTTDYASMYYDTYIHGNDGYNDDCVIFLIDMEHRNTNIFAYEDAAIRMNSTRSDTILDAVTPKLKNGDYDDAAETFINQTNTYLGEEPSKGQGNNSNAYNGTVPGKGQGNNSNTYGNRNSDNIFFKLWFQILIAVIIGATSVGIMVFNSGGKVTTNSSTYLDHSNSKLTGCFDHYIRTTTTRTKKADTNNNSGGGGGGTTGGGSSFSSGSQRSF